MKLEVLNGWRAQLPSDRPEAAFADKAPRYSEAEAVAEASRCLYCADAPCMQACPTHIDVPTFIHKIATGNVKGSARTIFESNLLGASCSRACPVEVLCVGSCVHHHGHEAPIAIGRLQRYATEVALAKDPQLLAKTRKPATGKKVALIGAGPASLACAGHLALEGHAVTLFEKKSLPGGLNSLGIAPYKLQATDALDEVEMVLGLGDVTVKTGMEFVSEAKGEGQVDAKTLLASFDAVFLGLGLGDDGRMKVAGEDGGGVVGATAFIQRMKTDSSLKAELSKVKHALCIGGGNTAMDVVQELAGLGVANVTLVYRRTEADMSGYAHEWENAKKHKVRIAENTLPQAVERDGAGKVTGLRCLPGAGGKPVDGGAAFTVPAELIVVAIGQAKLGALTQAFPGLQLTAQGHVAVSEAFQTGHAKVWAGGDLVNGGKEVVDAAQHGKLAARSIHAALSQG